VIDKETIENMGRAAAVATELAASSAAGAWIGRWADDRWGFDPYLTLLGVALGLTIGVIAVVQTMKRWG
jgi:F0F1-type ATP synthase assembly protein I